MYKLSHRIEIGDWTVKRPSKVRIYRSVETLSDTAEVELPGMRGGQALEVESQISVGDAVKIELGYDGELREEFAGYVKRIGSDRGVVKIECEDELWQTRRGVEDKEYRNVSVAELLADVLKQCGIETVRCSYDFRYDKFAVVNATGWDVLKKVQEEVKPNIYIEGGELVVAPKYAGKESGRAAYDFRRNVEKGGTSLEWRKKEDRRIQVVVEGETRDGKRVRCEAGVTGGDKVTVKLPGVSDRESLQKRADEILEEKSYTGYSGRISGWLTPYCTANYIVSLHDPAYEYKDGEYYVTAVETEYGPGGGRRKIEIGKRLK